MGKTLKKIFSFDRIIGVAMLGAFISLFVVDPYPVQFLRVKAFDMYQRIQPREIPPIPLQPVAIIDLDERSLSEVGQWPWSRLTIAKMVANLLNSGVAVVAFDIVFPEPDRMNPEGIVESLFNIDDATRGAILKLPSNDDLLANVVKQGNVVLGQAGYWDVRPESSEPPISKSVAWKGLVPGAPKPHAFLPSFRSMVRNIEVIEKAAKGHGIFSLVQETDGIVRRVPTLFQYGGEIYPALSVEMMRVMFQRRTIVADVGLTGIEGVGIAPKKLTDALRGLYRQLLTQTGETEALKMVDNFFPDGLLKLPTDGKGRMWPYFSKSDPSKYISAVDVLNNKVDPKKLRGKMAIIGTSAVGMLDIRATPIDSVIPGVEVHAQVIEAAFSGAFLSRPAWINGAEILLIALGGVLIIWLVPSVGAKWTLAVFLLLAGGASSGSWYLFTEKKVLFDVTFAVGAMFFLYTTLTYLNFSREEAQKKQTRDAFSKYLSPDMVESVAADPSKLKLGGDKRDMTLLFCDVRGFTTISEQFDAEGLTALINKLLTPLTNVIMGHKGTVDKYMGDCIMAFWNAPLDDPDHVYNACVSSLLMIGEMGPLNDRLEIEAKEEGRKHIPLKVGLGLNTGECVVGNMGSDQRFDYSVLGDTVNLASRLEGQSKSYGMNIVLGPTTCSAVKDRLATIDLDYIQVKGKTEGTYIYGLMGDGEIKEKPEFINLQNKIVDAMKAYREQRFDEAADLFKEIRTLGDQEHKPWNLDVTLDVLCDLYDERIAEYKINPPPADWNGVFVATSK
ncbi:MAG: adenylate/guanylate cyclase domain-containing protein [Rhodospirillaceae bacterium]|nr:adenylate/guanylate cyclase domain-containing protein [Rhodospirillaceae bacterium]